MQLSDVNFYPPSSMTMEAIKRMIEPVTAVREIHMKWGLRSHIQRGDGEKEEARGSEREGRKVSHLFNTLH